MSNEKKLREEWEEYQPELNEKYFDEVKGSAHWWIKKLHQAELNCITEQIERIGKHNAGVLNEFQLQMKPNLPMICSDERVALIPAIEIATKETLAPLIERKRELEEIIGKEEA